LSLAKAHDGGGGSCSMAASMPVSAG
jgi:hypothetical protein